LIVYRLRRECNEWDKRLGRNEGEYAFFHRDKSTLNGLTIYRTRKAAERALAAVNPRPDSTYRTNVYEIVAYELVEVTE
jgi:glutamine phosphoribosylpyrophosphate amidotransferase